MAENSEKFLETIPAVQNFRIIEYDNVYSSHIHQSGAHELLYVLDGKCTLELENGMTFPAGTGDFLLVPRMTQHRDIFEPLRGLKIMMVVFSWKNAEDFFSKVTNVELHRLDFATRSEVRRRLEFMYGQWSRNEISHRNANIQLHALLMLIYHSVLQSEDSTENEFTGAIHPKLIQQAKFFLTENFASEITLDQMSQQLGISPSYLSRMFQKEFGVSFSAYLTTVRLENAVSLLRHTSLQIAEIAYRCGFKDSSYFIKTFRQHYGKTPGNFRS
jgi:AraC-like DNA-binding protein